MSPLRFALIGVLSLSLSPAASLAGEPREPGKDARDESKQVFVFPFGVAVPGHDVYSEVLCKGTIDGEFGVVYDKCVNKTFKDFEFVAVKYQRLLCNDAMLNLDKDQLMRLRKLSALHLAYDSLHMLWKNKQRDPDSFKAWSSAKVVPALERLRYDLGKIVERCYAKDHEVMRCDPGTDRTAPVAGCPKGWDDLPKERP